MLIPLFPPAAWAESPPPRIPGVEPVCLTAADCLTQLQSKDPKTRQEAIVVLEKLKDPQAVPELIRIVEDHRYGRDVYYYEITPESQLVVTAMRALGAIRDRRAVPVLAEFIRREKFIQYRVLAAEMIRMIGVGAENIPHLLELLSDPHSSIRSVIFDAIRRADDPVTRRYAQRFTQYVPRADMIDDSITPPADEALIQLPIYPDAKYLYYASASEQWIMREGPQRLAKTQWLHTFFTKDPLEKVVDYYESRFELKALALARIEKKYNYRGTEDPEPEFIGEGYGFVLKKSARIPIRPPIVILSIYEDRILQGTAITIFSPK
jgi:hypothetical protein